VSKAWLEKLLPPGTEVTVTTFKDKREKYGRYLGVIWLKGENINQRCVTEGYAKPYMV